MRLQIRFLNTERRTRTESKQANWLWVKCDQSLDLIVFNAWLSAQSKRGCIRGPFGEGGFEAFEAFEGEGSKGRGGGGGGGGAEGRKASKASKGEDEGFEGFEGDDEGFEGFEG